MDSRNVIALVSGGKDSLFAITHCLSLGHRIISLANIFPHNYGEQLNYMYQTVAYELVPRLSRALNLPLYRIPVIDNDELPSSYLANVTQILPDNPTPSSLNCTQCPYLIQLDADNNVNCLTHLLHTILHQLPHANAVCTGALLSTYQRVRVEHSITLINQLPCRASHPKLISLAPLWLYPLLPPDYSAMLAVRGMRESHFNVRIVRVATEPLLTNKRKYNLYHDSHGLIHSSTFHADQFWRSSSPPGALGVQLISPIGQIDNFTFVRDNFLKFFHRFDPSPDFRLALFATSKEYPCRSSYGVQLSAALLGEGGEYETFVINAPSMIESPLLHNCNVDLNVMFDRDGGVESGASTAWFSFEIRDASLCSINSSDKTDESKIQLPLFSLPELWDTEFSNVLKLCVNDNLWGKMTSIQGSPNTLSIVTRDKPTIGAVLALKPTHLLCISNLMSPNSSDAECQTHQIIYLVQARVTEYIDNTIKKDKNQCIHVCLLQCNIILQDMNDFEKVNAVYENLFHRNIPGVVWQSNPAARVTVACDSSLIGQDIRVMISVILAISEQYEQRESKFNLEQQCLSHLPTSYLHIQSVSYWAPACIGPYAQATNLSVYEAETCQINGQKTYQLPLLDIVFLAGQIPLKPISMKLIEEHTQTEDILLSLQHLFRVARYQNVDWWSWGIMFTSQKNLGISSSDIILNYIKVARIAGLAWDSIHDQCYRQYTHIQNITNNNDFEKNFSTQSNYIHERFSYTTIPGPPNYIYMPEPITSNHKNNILIIIISSLPRDAPFEWSGLGLHLHRHTPLHSLTLHVHHESAPCGEWPLSVLWAREAGIGSVCGLCPTWSPGFKDIPKIINDVTASLRLWCEKLEKCFLRVNFTLYTPRDVIDWTVDNLLNSSIQVNQCMKNGLQVCSIHTAQLFPCYAVLSGNGHSGNLGLTGLFTISE